MTERTAHILESVVQEFINGGEPVSSGHLYEHYEFGIKPAMIRLILDELEEEGYLVQPHHSAGRIPTDAGYEFFARRMLTAVPAPRENVLRSMLEERAWPDLLEKLSTELGILSVMADSARDAVYKAGLEHLIENLEIDDREMLLSVIRDFEEVDERLPRAAPKMGEGPKVFIGKKSPVTKSESLSVVGGNYKVGDAMISIIVIGPKRMDYKKTIRIFKGL